ncbi:MAG: TetR family transcriptional regulator [Acidimicrobiales bacterium]
MTFTDRLPLTRQRVADAALAFIDEHGLDGLSMRKLGAELGVEAMSLYNHVTNKADLLGAVAERLFQDVLDAYGEPSGDWKVHARALCHAYVDVAAAHPLAVSLLITPTNGSQSAHEFDQRIVGAARRFSDDDRIGALAFATVSNWVIGTIVQQHGLMGPAVIREPAAADAETDDELICFQRAAEQLSADERFDEGLEVVLAGLEARYFDAPPSSE